MCGGSSSTPAPPPAPDPAATAAAQAQYNLQAGQDNAYLNAVDQYGPYGSTTFARRPDGTPYAQATTLSPEVQQWLDSQFGTATSLQDATAKQLSYLPQDQFKLPTGPTGNDIASQSFGSNVTDPNNFAQPLAGSLYNQSAVGLSPTPSTQDIAQTFYNQAVSRVQPDLDAAKKAKSVELAQRGINPGDQIYNDEMNRIDRNQGNTLSDISNQANLAAGQEQSRQFGQNLSEAQYGGQDQARLQAGDLSNRSFLGTEQNQQYNQLLSALGYGSGQYQTNLSNQLLERNQPFSEAAALMGSTPNFQTPSFQGTSPVNVAAPDYTGVVNSNYAVGSNNANKAAALAQSGSNSLLSSIGQIGAAAAPLLLSDENMKTDRHPADGEHVLAAFRDMPVDDYRYKDGARAAFDLPERRTGTMAQDYAEHFGGDGHTIDMGDAMGKLMAAMKALDKRTAHMEAA